MPPRDDPLDPKGLIHEAYRIDGITAAECRSIFLDWAIGMPADADARERAATLLARLGPDAPDHPMTEVLKAAADAPSTARRRGGARGRTRDQSI